MAESAITILDTLGLLVVSLGSFHSTVNLTGAFHVWLWASGPKPSAKVPLGAVGYCGDSYAKNAVWSTNGSIVLDAVYTNDVFRPITRIIPIPQGVQFN